MGLTDCGSRLFGLPAFEDRKDGWLQTEVCIRKKSYHKPTQTHPGNIVKGYAIKQVIDHLKEKGKIEMSNYLKYKEYLATLEYSAEDEVFYGKLFGINDLVTFEGASVKNIKTAFEEAVDDYIETCKELNKKPEKTFKGSFNVRIPSDLHKDAAFVAVQHSISLNDFVKGAIQYAVKHKQEITKELLES